MLESMGCAAQVVAGSVANADDVGRAMNEVSLPIKGIIHMGMVLHDQAFPRMTLDDWRGATDPKIAGARNLLQASLDRKLELDFFILFGSQSVCRTCGER